MTLATKIDPCRRCPLGKKSSAESAALGHEDLRAGQPLPATRNELGEDSTGGVVAPSEGGGRQRAKKGAVLPPGSMWSDGALSRGPPHSERSQRELESATQPRTLGRGKSLPILPGKLSFTWEHGVFGVCPPPTPRNQNDLSVWRLDLPHVSPPSASSRTALGGGVPPSRTSPETRSADAAKCWGCKRP